MRNTPASVVSLMVSAHARGLAASSCQPWRPCAARQPPLRAKCPVWTIPYPLPSLARCLSIGPGIPVLPPVCLSVRHYYLPLPLSLKSLERAVNFTGSFHVGKSSPRPPWKVETTGEGHCLLTCLLADLFVHRRSWAEERPLHREEGSASQQAICVGTCARLCIAAEAEVWRAPRAWRSHAGGHAVHPLLPVCLVCTSPGFLLVGLR